MCCKYLLVLLQDEECDDALLAGACQVIRYQFVDFHFATGVYAWETDSDSDVITVNVLAQCAALEGNFSQQALNRIVGQSLFRHQVDVLVVIGVTGVTIDLPRVAKVLGVPSVWLVDEFPEIKDKMTSRWLLDAQESAEVLRIRDSKERVKEVIQQAGKKRVSLPESDQFDYANYEFCQRDHPFLMEMQVAEVVHFRGCKKVLDLGCGVGVFLELLRQAGVNAMGVERDPMISEYGRGLGLDIVTDDALDFLRQTSERFDGVYCSHFVEHLPFDAVKDLIGLLAGCLQPGGMLVLTFPDPESIRSQLLGFWRDPEHVRFYHPELIRGLAEAAGLVCEWTSYDEQPHDVGLFPEEPPEIDALPVLVESSSGNRSWATRVMNRLGWVSARQGQVRQIQMQEVVAQQNKVIKQLTERTDALWAVNKTWAWNDNVTLRLKKS